MSVNAILQASGNTFTSMLLTIGSQWIIQIPAAFLMSRFTSLGLTGLWLAFPLTNIVMTFVAIAVFRKGKWKQKKITTEEKLSTLVSEEIESSEAIPYDA